MNYAEHVMEEVVNKEKELKEFVLNLQALNRTVDGEAPKKPNERDKVMVEAASTTHTKMHEAFCDNFNTPLAVEAF